jgi:phospholipase C
VSFGVAFVLASFACNDSRPAGTAGGGESSAAPCSQLHLALDGQACGAAAMTALELTPVGNHAIFAQSRPTNSYRVWLADANGMFDRSPRDVFAPGAATSAFTYLPGATPRVLMYGPTNPAWSIYQTVPRPASDGDAFAFPTRGAWPVTDTFTKGDSGAPAGHAFLGLGHGFVLARHLGDGRTRVFQIQDDANGLASLERLTALDGGPKEAFVRGHRVVRWGDGRLLEWLPRICPSGIPAPCGADYRIWPYTTEATSPHDAIEAVPSASGTWPGLGPQHEILTDEDQVFLWDRQVGTLSSYPLVEGDIDPFARPPLDTFQDDKLISPAWEPPTQSPHIKHVVIVLQDGRSFDTYFGQYCQGDGTADTLPQSGLPSGIGPTCCGAAPATLGDGLSCTALGTDDAHVPVATAECLREKLSPDAASGFTSRAPGVCRHAGDFACAPVGDGVDPIPLYHQWAASGALADRFFQTYAYAENADKLLLNAEPARTNLLYLVGGRFADPSVLDQRLTDTPLLTKELARNDVAWAIYSGNATLNAFSAFGIPLFHDPSWYPFRSLEGGELERDVALGTLPPVAVVLPDVGDPERSESPGHPLQAPLAHTAALLAAIQASSTYRDSTLVLLTYLTAGGFYDHVAPPAPPTLDVDGSSPLPLLEGIVAYGPRVPLLALGRFARKGFISHVPMEMSSLLKFIEWNWLHAAPLKGFRERKDPRAYRDISVNNIGSLIDAVEAGGEVPGGTR